jgi:hypothetical protein
MRRERVRGWLGISLLLVIAFVVSGVVSGQTSRAMLAHLREEVDRSGREEQALRAQEQELLKALSGEEKLWIDFNSRLDELERVSPTTR